MKCCINCIHCLSESHVDREVSENESYYTFWCTVNACQIYTPRGTTCKYHESYNGQLKEKRSD